jgi:hypothetical protein
MPDVRERIIIPLPTAVERFGGVDIRAVEAPIADEAGAEANVERALDDDTGESRRGERKAKSYKCKAAAQKKNRFTYFCRDKLKGKMVFFFFIRCGKRRNPRHLIVYAIMQHKV